MCAAIEGVDGRVAPLLGYQKSLDKGVRERFWEVARLLAHCACLLHCGEGMFVAGTKLVWWDVSELVDALLQFKWESVPVTAAVCWRDGGIERWVQCG